ncbi:hypothetical protein CPC08DRAFT_329295 [Agrocybe pediades]|nr:hypothetical protein CPC08DRAFT_329295 [Agrocybe pediades]
MSTNEQRVFGFRDDISAPLRRLRLAMRLFTSSSHLATGKCPLIPNHKSSLTRVRSVSCTFLTLVLPSSALSASLSTFQSLSSLSPPAIAAVPTFFYF